MRATSWHTHSLAMESSRVYMPTAAYTWQMCIDSGVLGRLPGQKIRATGSTINSTTSSTTDSTTGSLPVVWSAPVSLPPSLPPDGTPPHPMHPSTAGHPRTACSHTSPTSVTLDSGWHASGGHSKYLGYCMTMQGRHTRYAGIHLDDWYSEWICLGRLCGIHDQRDAGMVP